MNERKYRGLTKEGKWVYGWPLFFKAAVVIIPQEYLDDKSRASYNRNEDGLAFELDSDCVEVVPETVGQFTGHKDKKNKDAYAGDKIQTYVNGHWCIDIIHWTKYGWYPWACDDDYKGKEFEIIGHDKLLEEQSDGN